MPPPIQPVTIEATVAHIEDLTHDVRAITLRMQNPPHLSFRAGQFVSFSIDRPGHKFSATRAYSIASSPDVEDSIVLLLNLIPGGPGSEYLFSLRPGAATTFRGPFGSFVLGPGTRDLLFVATGTGIAPFLSMLAWLAAHEQERHVLLVWGLRYERDVYYQPQLEELTMRMPNLTCVTSLSQSEGRWRGATGRVQGTLRDRVTSVENLDAYLCGNGAMISDVTQLLRALGVCPIHREQYFLVRA